MRQYGSCVSDGYRLKTSPTYISLGCDESCNLSCPTCRSHVKAMAREESDRLLERLNKSVKPMLKDCEVLDLLITGDVFASRAVSAFLKEIPMSLCVSMDGACRDTYEMNRRGAKWDILIKNLQLLKQMRERQECKINMLSFNMVVQHNNYQEIEAFIKFAEEMGADFVNYQQLANWGTFGDSEYKCRDICAPDHPAHVLLVRKMKKVMASGSKVKIEQNVVDLKEQENYDFLCQLPLKFPNSSDTGMIMGWHRQDADQGFRFVERCASIVMKRNPDQHTIHIKGFIPESILEVHQLKIKIDGTLAGEYAVKAGDGFDFPVSLSELGTEDVFELTLEFDSAHVPGEGEADRRVMSACILEII